MEEGRVEVRLDGRGGIGRLNKVAAGGAAHFGGEAGHGFSRAEVLNDGIAEDEIEGLVGKREGGAVAVHVENPRRDRLAGARLVQNDEARAHGAEVPDARSTADIEDEPVRVDVEQTREQAHAAAAKTGAEARERVERVHEG